MPVFANANVGTSSSYHSYHRDSTVIIIGIQASVYIGVTILITAQPFQKLQEANEKVESYTQSHEWSRCFML